MKSLHDYLECECTPANTLGLGNPGIDGDIMTEPLPNSKRRNKKKKY